MEHSVWPRPRARRIGEETESKSPRDVICIERHVTGVSTYGGPSPPEEIPPNASLESNQRDTEITTKAHQLRGGLDPALDRDQVITLGQRRQLIRMQVMGNWWAFFSGDWHMRAMLAHT